MYDVLKGVRVIDLSTVVLGPYATQMIADMGADVIKVEPVGGDVFRSARPGRAGGDGAGFLNINRNKRSIVLDLTQENDLAILYDLISTADVVVHNMREKSAQKLGIDYAAVKAVKGDIVYCSARGFGRGLYGDEPAYDDCIQAASGLAALNANEAGEPRFVRTILCDKVAGLHLAFAIASGLAARGLSGKGCHIETPMFEAMASFLLVEQLSGQSFIPPMPDRGYARLNAAGRKPYKTRDGYVTIMPYTGAQWRRFFLIIGNDAMAESEVIHNGEKRSAAIESLYEMVEQAAPSRSSQEWLDVLRAQDIPCAPVNRLEDLPTEPHLVESGFFQTMSHPAEGELLYAASPFRVETAEKQADKAPPSLDADREDILADIGRKS